MTKSDYLKSKVPRLNFWSTQQRRPRYSEVQAWWYHTQSHSQIREKLAKICRKKKTCLGEQEAGLATLPSGHPFMIPFGLNCWCLYWHFGNSQLPWKATGDFCLTTLPFSSCLCSVCGLNAILRLSCHFKLVSQITVINANSQHELWAAQMLDNPRAGREPSFYIS